MFSSFDVFLPPLLLYLVVLFVKVSDQILIVLFRSL